MSEALIQVEERVAQLIERLTRVEQERTRLREELEQLQSQLSVLSTDSEKQREQGSAWREERQTLLTGLEETLSVLEGKTSSGRAASAK